MRERDRGLVERGEGSDRRSYTLHLSAAGKAIQRRVQQEGMVAAAGMFASFDAQERVELADFLRRSAGDNEDA